MRIRLKYRRGSLALEMTMALPLLLMVMFAAGYVLEAMMFRHDVAFAVRNGAVRAAADLPCDGTAATLDPRTGTERTLTLDCRRIDDERGLRAERPFFRAMTDQAHRHWGGFLRDIDPGAPLAGVVVTGGGTVRVTDVALLSGAFGATPTGATHRRVNATIWSHHQTPWREAYDPVVWDRLTMRGTGQLFPHVFPAE